MTKSEYPFDNNGNYRRDWVKRGASGRTSSSSLPPEPVIHTYGAQTPVKIPVRPGRSPSTSTYSPPPKISTPASSAVYHTVRPGDTLFGISRKHQISVPAIKSKNGLSSDLIRVGQKLRIR